MPEQEKPFKRNGALHYFGMLIPAIAFQALYMLFVAHFFGTWSETLRILAVVGGTLLNTALLTIDYVCYALQRQAIYKFCMIAYIILIFFAAVLFALVETGFDEVMRDEKKLEAYLERAGKWMIPLFILLQFLQVVVLPIPSTVTVLAGAALFGPLFGSLYSLIGIAAGSVTAFAIGRFAGYRGVAWMVGKDALDKWQKKVKGKDKLFLTAMFLLPVFPDDILCFVAGLSSMSFPYFFAVIFISRVLSIFTTSYSVTLIPFDTWWGLLIWGILFALVVVLFVVLYKKSDVILAWFDRTFRRETRVESKVERDEFLLEMVDADGSVVKKGVKKADESRETAHGDDTVSRKRKGSEGRS